MAGTLWSSFGSLPVAIDSIPDLTFTATKCGIDLKDLQSHSERREKTGVASEDRSSRNKSDTKCLLQMRASPLWKIQLASDMFTAKLSFLDAEGCGRPVAHARPADRAADRTTRDAAARSGPELVLVRGGRRSVLNSMVLWETRNRPLERPKDQPRSKLFGLEGPPG